MNEPSPRLVDCDYPCASYATVVIKTMGTPHRMILIKES